MKKTIFIGTAAVALVVSASGATADFDRLRQSQKGGCFFS